jgi:hypothetical protein
MAISKKVRDLLIERDGGCYCCNEIYMVTVQHRANRQMGGSRKRDNLANLMLLCSETNQALESDPVWQRRGLEYGWKLRQWDDPLYVPVYEPMWGNWWRLDDEGGREMVSWTDHPF